MKYQYGVEYETNGEKPDLPDDVKVDIFQKGCWLSGPEINGSRLSRTVGEWFWAAITAFRIVDERYKPKEKDTNDWHKRGERPPIGTECEVKCGQSWHRTKVVGYNDDSNSIVFLARESDPYIYDGTVLQNFRPLRTETDELVDAAIKVLESVTEVHATDKARRSFAEGFINAGYRKIKPMTEDEFVVRVSSDWSVDYEIDGDFLYELYRADCRLIETGE